MSELFFFCVCVFLVLTTKATELKPEKMGKKRKTSSKLKEKKAETVVAATPRSEFVLIFFFDSK